MDEPWVPGAADTSLYLRPFMIASEAFLGVRPARRIDYLVIASPVGPYFKAGLAQYTRLAGRVSQDNNPVTCPDQPQRQLVYGRADSAIERGCVLKRYKHHVELGVACVVD